MYKQCVTKQAKARQRDIEAGLLNAMCVRSYEDITVSELCDAINIPRKAFYRYFSSKEGALYALIDHTLMDFIEEFLHDERPYLSAKRIMTSFFTFWLGQKHLLDALEYNDLSGILLQRSIAIIMTDDSLFHHIFPSDARDTRDYVAIYLISGIVSLVIQWHHDKFKKTPAQMAAIALSVLPYSMMTQK